MQKDNEKDIEKLKELLMIRINQSIMLSNTLMQMNKRNPNSESIKEIENEISLVLNEVANINNDISSMIKNSNPYDSVEKISDDKNKIKNLVYSISKSKDDAIKSNAFLVDFGDELNIPAYMVNFVSFDSANNMLNISIYDFVATLNNIKCPVLSLISHNNKPFTIRIKHLDDNKNVSYEEIYYDCSIKSLYRDPLDYSNNDNNMLHLQISYDRVVYEAIK